MEEQYNGAVILVKTTPSVKGLRWRATSEVKYLKDGRETVEHLKLDLEYDSPQQAERANLVFAKKWVDAKL